ncbi:transient receptor potential cation channel subfamily A member 1 homolog isoform X2 [Dysidea avara]|uniref:transient receptor potential cation channel subfamily A member 1 homolog isoform X2 n=1 Tax=Dysidea avara TaxID=196820 RepID=UPI003331141D
MDRRASNATDFPAKSTRVQSIISLGQPSLSFYSEDDDDLLDLANKLQTDGTKAAMRGRFQKVKDIVEEVSKHSCNNLIDLTTEDEGYNMLHFAVCNKHPEIVQYLIESGANTECTTKDEENDTPLMLAIRYYDSFSQQHTKAFSTLKRGESSAQVLTCLLDKADVNAPNASGTTPLSLAVQKQDENIVELLLDTPDIEVNKSNLQGYTPLHYASAGKKTEIITMLLDKGADLFSKTARGYIPIHIACQKGSSEILEHLITKSPSEKQQQMLEAKDNNGNTPLLLAAEAQSQAAFNLLQTTYKCDSNAKTNCGDTVLHKFAKNYDAMLNPQLLEDTQYLTMMDGGNSARDSPLHIACQRGHWKTAVVLIEKNADFELKNAVGNTPLVVAIAGGKREVVLHMLQAINKVKNMTYKEILNLPTRNNNTIIQWAIESDHTVLVEAVLQIDLHLATESDCDTGKTLLHIAASSGALCTTKILLNNKHVCELLQSADVDGKTPLMLAAQNGHLECVKVLHDPDGNMMMCSSDTDGPNSGLNIVDKDGYTALHLACLNGHDSVVKYLCTCNADLEACEGEGGTPLSCAASQGHKHIINYLLEQDVDVNGAYIKSKTTPLILASQNGHGTCVQLFLTNPHINVTLQNKDGYNCLAVAALNRQHPHWKKALKGCDQNGVTPLRLLIKLLPDVAEVVLYRCVQRIQNEKEEVTAIELSFDFLDDFQDPPGGMFQKYYQMLCGSGNDQHDFTELSTLPQTTSSDNMQPVVFDKDNHVLQWMVKYERTNLLQHPVTSQLLSYKWRTYAMPGFIVNLGIFFLFLATLTSYAAVLPLPNDDVCQNDSCEGSDSDQAYLRFSSVVLLVFCAIRAVLETFQLITRRLQYLVEPENYMEILMIICTTVFALAGHAGECFCLVSATWQIGALAVFLAWIDLVVFLKKLALTGVQINMLQNVVLTFLKLVYLPAILIVSFALPFYMLFAMQEVTTPYNTPAYSLMRSLVMTTGELDYSDTFQFGDEGDGISYNFMSNFLWIVFIVLMPILFANLLIGLAVGDIQKVEENATLTYLGLQVDLALHTEQKLPWIIRQKLKKTSHKVEKYSAMPFYLMWYYKVYDKLSGNSFKQLEKNVIQLETQENLQNMLQGIGVLEPIDEVKAQVQRNLDVLSNVQSTIEQMKMKFEHAKTQDDKILAAIKDLKQDMNKKGPSLSSARSQAKSLLRKVI